MQNVLSVDKICLHTGHLFDLSQVKSAFHETKWYYFTMKLSYEYDEVRKQGQKPTTKLNIVTKLKYCYVRNMLRETL